MNFLKNVDWKAFLKGPIFVVLVAVGCFFAGRYTSPENVRIETVDKVVEKHHEQTVVTQQIDINSLLRQVQDKTKVIERNVVREVITQKDGTKIERETDLSNINTTQHKESSQETKTTLVLDVKKLLDEYRAEDHSKTTVTEKIIPKWRVGALVGYSHGIVWDVPSLPTNVLVGAYVERNLFGPFSGGVWVTNSPGAGVQLSGAF